MENIRFVKGLRNSRRTFGTENHSEDLNRIKFKQEADKLRLDRRRALSRWKFKACPKCCGDLCSTYGEDFTCFQCGYICYSWMNKGGRNGKTEKS